MAEKNGIFKGGRKGAFKGEKENIYGKEIKPSEAKDILKSIREEKNKR